MIENPFLTFGYESPAYFCDRQEETRTLISQVINGNNVALISPRRMGKTGLICHCYAQSQLNDYYTFLIDIYATKSLQDMVYQMGSSIVKRLKPWGQAALDRFLQVVTSLRTGISFDGNGNASWNLEMGDIQSPSFTLDEIFAYLESADRRCIVAIDEFQAISGYSEKNVEALLRTYVQQCRNAVFIFSGSQQSMMSEMFSSPSRPFYQSVSLMFLKPVALVQYEQFAYEHFRQRNRHIADGVVKDIYERFDGITWYVQKVLNQLFSMTPESGVVSNENINTAIFQIVRGNEEAYKDTIFQLTAKQRDLLLAVAKMGKVSQITGSAFIKGHKLTSASSVQKAAAALIAKGLLTQQLGVYEVYDKFMGIWLQNN